MQRWAPGFEVSQAHEDVRHLRAGVLAGEKRAEGNLDKGSEGHIHFGTIPLKAFTAQVEARECAAPEAFAGGPEGR